MKPEDLSRQAIRLAQRRSRKAGRPLTREEILALRVQIVEPWKRAFIVFLGILAAGFAFLCYRGGAPAWFWVAAGAAAAAVILIGVFGRKAYLDRELSKLKEDAPSRILDAIGNAL